MSEIKLMIKTIKVTFVQLVRPVHRVVSYKLDRRRKPTVQCNKSRDPASLLEKLRPALQQLAD